MISHIVCVVRKQQLDSGKYESVSSLWQMIVTSRSLQECSEGSLCYSVSPVEHLLLYLYLNVSMGVPERQCHEPPYIVLQALDLIP